MEIFKKKSLRPPVTRKKLYIVGNDSKSTPLICTTSQLGQCFHKLWCAYTLLLFSIRLLWCDMLLAAFFFDERSWKSKFTWEKSTLNFASWKELSSLWVQPCCTDEISRNLRVLETSFIIQNCILKSHTWNLQCSGKTQCGLMLTSANIN